MKRIVLIGIIVEDFSKVSLVNDLLHEYRQFVIGRMGIPHREHDLSIISVALEATTNDISALSGKLGAIKGIKVKALYAK
jgi:putative iron-only hydrogenase system regulator